MKKFIEIGCGTGYVLKRIHDLGHLKLTGAEIYLEGLKFAKKRLPDIEFVQLNATNMPFCNQFDAVGAFDVLEHIEDDITVIQNVNKILLPDGLFFITVPQYMWMWSETDECAFHKRRYTRNELINKLRKEGFNIEYIGSFVFMLFPFMFFSRLLKKIPKVKNKKVFNSTAYEELKINRFVNTFFSFVMKIDELLIEWGLSLPYGGSLICVARKK